MRERKQERAQEKDGELEKNKSCMRENGQLGVSESVREGEYVIE